MQICCFPLGSQNAKFGDESCGETFKILVRAKRGENFEVLVCAKRVENFEILVCAKRGENF